MNIEIERKFLVSTSFNKEVLQKEGVKIWQAYLVSEKDKSIRVRQKGDKAYLTIKTGSNTLSRKEFEYEIPFEDVLEMKMEFTNAPSIEKTRYEYNYKGHLWEVDIFEGSNSGLILCEIELKNEREEFEKPIWIGKEVTNNPTYLNANLAK